MDGYYLWGVNETTPQLRNFDVNHNTFSLSYAEVAFAKPATETSRGGFRVDFGAGDTANMVNAFEPGGTDYLKYVQQAYVSYLAPVGKGLTIDFGKFVTPAGAEVIENKDNFNYSRGLLFALAIPYYHMGARVGYAVNDKVSRHRVSREWLEQRQRQQRRKDRGRVAGRQAHRQAVHLPELLCG